MSVPDYQSLMLPVLQFAQDGFEHTIGETIEAIGAMLALPDGDRKELLPSGRQFRFDNRVHWARSYLKQAGLLENTGRGKFRISERGMQVLQTNPAYIGQKYLEQFPEFMDFKNRSNRSDEEIEVEVAPDATHTPEEILEASYQNLRNDLA